MVCMDIYVNETTRHADVILPAPSPLEDSHYDVAFSQLSFRNQARYSDAVFPLPEGQLPEWATVLRLCAIVEGRGAGIPLRQLDDEFFQAETGRRLGEHAEAAAQALAHRSGPSRLLDLGLRTGPYGDQFGRRPEGLNLDKLQAAPGGIDLGELQPRIPALLRTASGQVELAPPLLVADLARVQSALAEAAPALVVIGRRQVRSNNSWMHNLPLLAKGPERCTALVNPSDARRLGLADGAIARITSRGGSVQARVEVSDEMMPGVVSLPHGWGHDLPGVRLSLAQQRPGANLNLLLDEKRMDPLSGNAVLGGVAVEMVAV
jgi:anaerobic selenocysteine-containing dehydrogenase